MFRVLIYPKETIEDLLAKDNQLFPLGIHVGFAIAMWAIMSYGAERSSDITWYFMESLFASLLVAVVGTLAIVYFIVLSIYFTSRRYTNRANYRDIMIAYSYGLIPLYTGLITGALIPRFFWPLTGVYLAWTIVLGIKLIGYTLEVKFEKAFWVYIISHSIATVFVYLPTLYLVFSVNNFYEQ